MSVREPRGREHGPAFWLGLALGWPLIGFGVWTLVRRSGATDPPNFAALFLGLALVHDLVVAPLASALALWVGPRLPVRARAPVAAAAIVSGALVLVSLPPLFSGGVPDNPSLLPRNYPFGLAVALAAVWAVTGAAVALARLRRRA